MPESADVALRETIRAHWTALRERVERACAAAGRSPSDVTIVAATKYATEEQLTALIDEGFRELGENRPQQLAKRAAAFASRTGLHWHLIGHLQRNKVLTALPIAHLIHSVDSLRLAHEINTAAAKRGAAANVLLEVNVSGEPSKDGFTPEAVYAEFHQILRLSHVTVRGFMTMAPESTDPESARPVFASLRELRDDLQRRAGAAAILKELSMGMSGDLEAAIAEGSTIIRIGSALFRGSEPA